MKLVTILINYELIGGILSSAVSPSKLYRQTTQSPSQKPYCIIAMARNPSTILSLVIQKLRIQKVLKRNNISPISVAHISINDKWNTPPKKSTVPITLISLDQTTKNSKLYSIHELLRLKLSKMNHGNLLSSHKHD